MSSSPMTRSSHLLHSRLHSFAWGYVAGVVLLGINVALAFALPGSCKAWCADCPLDWTPWEYNIANASLVAGGYAQLTDVNGTGFAWPGINAPCAVVEERARGVNAAPPFQALPPLRVCTTFGNGSASDDDAYVCDETGCRLAASPAAAATARAAFVARGGFHCVDAACPYFKCARADCGRGAGGTGTEVRANGRLACDASHTLFRINLLSGGVWWLFFGSIAVVGLKPRPRPPLPATRSILTEGVRRVVLTLRSIRRMPNVVRFLIANWIYSDGYATIMTGASLLAVESPINATATELGILVIIGEQRSGWH